MAPNPGRAGAPLIVMAHGRHTPFDVPGSDGRWTEAATCASDRLPGPSLRSG